MEKERTDGNNVVSLMQETEEGKVEFEIESKDGSFDSDLAEIDTALEQNAERLKRVETKIDRLTARVELRDYGVAVGCGLLSGLLDGIFIDAFSLKNAKEYGSDKVEKMIMRAARKKNPDVKDLADAVHELEKVVNPADSANDQFAFTNHHFYEFSHHRSFLGLFFSVLGRFTGNAYGIDPKTGAFKIVRIAGYSPAEEGSLLKAIKDWHLHLLSDMAGSHNSVLKGNYGTGIPGPILSFLSEVASWKGFRKDGKNRFVEWLDELFEGDILKDLDGEKYRLDYRMELGLKHEIGKQAFPVILTECLVRFYRFAIKLFDVMKQTGARILKDKSRFFQAVKEAWKSDRTRDRMLTVAFGVLSATDLFFATIRSGGRLSGFLVRVNYIGVARFAVAVTKDVAEELSRSSSVAERERAIRERTELLNSKLSILNEGTWVRIGQTGKSVKETNETINDVSEQFAQHQIARREDLNEIGSMLEAAEKQDPTFTDRLKNVLED